MRTFPRKQSDRPHSVYKKSTQCVGPPLRLCIAAIRLPGLAPRGQRASTQVCAGDSCRRRCKLASSMVSKDSLDGLCARKGDKLHTCKRIYEFQARLVWGQPRGQSFRATKTRTRRRISSAKTTSIHINFKYTLNIQHNSSSLHLVPFLSK